MTPPIMWDISDTFVQWNCLDINPLNTIHRRLWDNGTGSAGS